MLVQGWLTTHTLIGSRIKWREWHAETWLMQDGGTSDTKRNNMTTDLCSVVPQGSTDPYPFKTLENIWCQTIWIGVSFDHNYDAETHQSQGDPCTKICVRPLADTIKCCLNVDWKTCTWLESMIMNMTEMNLERLLGIYGNQNMTRWQILSTWYDLLTSLCFRV